MSNTNSLDLEASSSQYATAADHADFQFGTGNFTIMTWLNPESIGGNHGFSGKTNGTIEGVQLFLNNEGRIRFDIYVSSTQVQGLSSTILSAGSWTHIACTRSQGSLLNVYFNGTLDAGIPAGTSSGSCSAIGNPWSLGGYDQGAGGGGTSYFDGQQNNHKVYKGTALSAAEIQAERYTQYPSKGSQVALWTLNNTYADATTGAHTLTSSNSPVFSGSVPFVNYTDGFAVSGLQSKYWG